MLKNGITPNKQFKFGTNKCIQKGCGHEFDANGFGKIHLVWNGALLS